MRLEYRKHLIHREFQSSGEKLTVSIVFPQKIIIRNMTP